MRLLRFRDLKPIKGISWSRVHVTRLEKLGQFPRRIQLGANTVAWDEAEIDAMLAAKAAARGASRHTATKTSMSAREKGDHHDG